MRVQRKKRRANDRFVAGLGVVARLRGDAFAERLWNGIARRVVRARVLHRQSLRGQQSRQRKRKGCVRAKDIDVQTRKRGVLELLIR